MGRFNFWRIWLFIVAIIIAVFGVLMAFLNQTAVFSTFNREINVVFWPNGEIGRGLTEFQNWVYGVWGATVASMGIFAAYVAHYPFARREKWARQCLAAGTVVWYVLDTYISLASGVIFNALFNTVIFLLIAVPLGFTWKEFEAAN
jgi:uncharacterized membrane protein